jgi:PIN domain nuclease of toxin-antitoxin system
MKLLLDTQLLLWAAGEQKRLTRHVRAMIEDAENEPIFSAASIWEIGFKCSLGRADFQADPRLLRKGLLENGYGELPVTSQHAIAVADLPSALMDPFDRILVAQSIVERMALLTSDPLVAQYSGLVRGT